MGSFLIIAVKLHSYKDSDIGSLRQFEYFNEYFSLGPAQYKPFSYTPYHFSEPQILIRLSQPIFLSFLYLNIARHTLVIELCRSLKIF